VSPDLKKGAVRPRVRGFGGHESGGGGVLLRSRGEEGFPNYGFPSSGLGLGRKDSVHTLAGKVLAVRGDGGAVGGGG
jgi:hypothetical protein